MLRNDKEQYSAYEIDFSGVLYMLQSLKRICALCEHVEGAEGDELRELFQSLETMDIMMALNEIAHVFMLNGSDGEVKLPSTTTLGKKTAAMLDPNNPEPLPDGFGTDEELPYPDFVSSLLGKAAKFFRPAAPGLIGTDSDIPVKPNLIGLQLPTLGDETLVFARQKDAEKFKANTSFPTTLVRLGKSGWEEI